MAQTVRETVYSLCIWEGDLFGAVPEQILCDWTYGMLVPKVWSKLPQEVLEMEILRKVPDSSKCRFLSVCKRWRQLLSSPEAFKKSASSDPRLLCKFYWTGLAGGVGPHCESWDPFRGIGFDPTEEDLQKASAVFERCSAVNKDCIMRVCYRYLDWMVLRDGLLFKLPENGGRYLFNPRESNAYVVNPVNRTWKLLPKCDGPGIPIQLKHFQGRVVSEPLGCAFQFFVVGQEMDEAGGEHHDIVLRYSSQSNSWDAFTATGFEFVERVIFAIGKHFVLWNGFFCISNGKAKVVYVAANPPNAGGDLSLVHTFPYPPSLFFAENEGLACYREELYFVGEVYVHNEVFPFDMVLSIAVWKLNFGNGSWEPISTAPRQVLDDFTRLFPRHTLVLSLQDFTVMDGMIAFNVRVRFKWNWAKEDKYLDSEYMVDRDNDVVSQHPSQYVYFRFAEKSWFSGSRFFCSKALSMLASARPSWTTSTMCSSQG